MKKNNLLIMFFLLILSGGTHAKVEIDKKSPIDEINIKKTFGGEGVGGGDRTLVARSNTNYDWDSFESNIMWPSSAIEDLSLLMHSLRIAMEHELSIENSILRVLPYIPKNGNDLSMEDSDVQAVKIFLDSYKRMEDSIFEKKGIHLDQYVKELVIEKIQECFDQNNKPVDMCTTLYDLNGPIWVTTSFLNKLTKKEGVDQFLYSALLYHELSRKLLGTEDDNHMYASIVRAIMPYFRDGFFTQAVCFVETNDCTNHDLSVGLFGAPGIPIPFVDYSCVERLQQRSEWYFNWDTENNNLKQEIKFSRGLLSDHKVTLYTPLDRNIGISRGKLKKVGEMAEDLEEVKKHPSGAMKDISSRFSFLYIEGYEEDEPRSKSDMRKSYGCKATPSVYPPVTEYFYTKATQTNIHPYYKTWTTECIKAEVGDQKINQECFQEYEWRRFKENRLNSH